MPSQEFPYKFYEIFQFNFFMEHLRLTNSTDSNSEVICNGFAIIFLQYYKNTTLQ